jgi:hypothetical protein
MLNIKRNSYWRVEVAQSIKWQHRAIQLKYDHLSAAAVFLTPRSCQSSILLLHIRVKQPDMQNWPPFYIVKNEWTFTSTSFFIFIIPLATRRTSPWRICAWKFWTPGWDFQKSFWLLVCSSLINICNSLWLNRWKWNHPIRYTTLKPVAWIIMWSIKTLG